MKIIWAVCFFYFPVVTSAQQKVSFYADDGLKITADLYLTDSKRPIIILLHQTESSRGEYIEIAPKLTKLGYNCLAVDLRAGDKVNYVDNETASRASELKLPNRFVDSKADIEAAINFTKRYNSRYVILMGSSYSASLCLLLAKEMDNIKAVIAFSPGEYFQPGITVKDSVSGLSLPIFIASTEMEYNYVKELSSGIESRNKILFKPSDGQQSLYGAKMLWSESQGSQECWFQLTYFISKL